MIRAVILAASFLSVSCKKDCNSPAPADFSVNSSIQDEKIIVFESYFFDLLFREEELDEDFLSRAEHVLRLCYISFFLEKTDWFFSFYQGPGMLDKWLGSEVESIAIFRKKAFRSFINLVEKVEVQSSGVTLLLDKEENILMAFPYTSKVLTLSVGVDGSLKEKELLVEQFGTVFF